MYNMPNYMKHIWISFMYFYWAFYLTVVRYFCRKMTLLWVRRVLRLVNVKFELIKKTLKLQGWWWFLTFSKTCLRLNVFPSLLYRQKWHFRLRETRISSFFNLNLTNAIVVLFARFSDYDKELTVSRGRWIIYGTCPCL